VIDERADRDPLRELLQSADVIDVVVRGDQKIDLGDAGVLDRVHQAVGVTAARIAGVDEHGLSRRRDPQRRLSAFRVDHVNP
jgi:hypothetical protein